MKSVTVLLTASGSQFAPGIIRCLKNNGEREIRDVGCDMSDDPTCPYLVDKFYKVPSAKDPNFINAILDICKTENVDIYLPQMSAELPVLLDNLTEFKKIGTIVSMTCDQSLNIANNKLHLFEHLKVHGIEVPRFEKANSIESFEKGLALLGYPEKPVCVKIPDSSGSKGIRVIDANKSRYDIFVNEKPSSLIVSKEDMMSTLQQAHIFPDLLLMEYMPGDEYTIGLVADNGKVLYLGGRRSPVMQMSIAQETIAEYNERAYTIATQVVESLNLDGNIGMDFMFDENGVAQLMEINPRIDATVSLFAAAGLNLPYLQIKQLLGEELLGIKINYGVRLKRRYLETFTDAYGNLINW